ncbi:hypothetical protein BDQ12DRAFT_625449 [Crucibulum laeve]|uniref:Uncharacterized protein n=1 Tax=Crucibulum laeve TaxID=68775 RepID=A0A5C3M9G5_9AGAR|nr:hypothetical protein BDQ12DRAFT_625449 [Crucibulum laeve]
MYRILKAGSESCWQTSESNAVDIATVADKSDGRPRVDQLYQLILSVPVQSVTTNSVDTISVTADDSNIAKKFYFGSGVDLKKTYVSVQLTTDARDQGWADEPDQGLWSWFEIAIFKSKSAPAKGSVLHSDSIKKDSTGNTLTWLSHRVALSSEYTEQTGPVFGKDHELWKNIETGDIVGVLACAQYASWECDVRSGSLKFLELVANVNA